MTRAGAAAPAIPLTRMDNADPELMEELLVEVQRIARSAAFIGGPEVEAFEDEFAAYCGTAHAVGISNGTDALALALRAMDIGPGDEVVVPANSFIATAEAVTMVGATPRFVDVDPETALVTAELIEPAIGPRTRCLIPVHLYGRTVDLDPILALARERRIRVLEDACQAHGALLRGRRAGSMGDAGCFSFYPAKNLGAWGDAGAIVTAEPELAKQVMLLRSHGEQPRYHHRMVGTTARLDALQAALLRVKLRRLEGWNDDRRRIGSMLREGLADTSLELPAPASANGDHVYHLFITRTKRREELRAFLDERGVSTAVHYPIPIHRTEAYAELGLGEGSLPVAERLAEEICTLPLFPTMSEEQVEQVIEAVQDFDQEAS